MFNKRKGFIMYEAMMGVAILCLTIHLCVWMLQNCQQQMNLEQARLANLKAHFERLDLKHNQAYKKGKQHSQKVYRPKRETIHTE